MFICNRVPGAELVLQITGRRQHNNRAWEEVCVKAHRWRRDAPVTIQLVIPEPLQSLTMLMWQCKNTGCRFSLNCFRLWLSFNTVLHVGLKFKFDLGTCLSFDNGYICMFFTLSVSSAVSDACFLLGKLIWGLDDIVEMDWTVSVIDFFFLYNHRWAV